MKVSMINLARPHNKDELTENVIFVALFSGSRWIDVRDQSQSTNWNVYYNIEKKKIREVFKVECNNSQPIF